MSTVIIKGTKEQFKRFGRKRFVAIVQSGTLQFAVRSLDPNKKQDIIHINGGSGRFYDQYNTTLNEYLDTGWTVIAERQYVKDE